MNNNKHYLAAIGAFTIWGAFSIALRAMTEFMPSTILYFRVLIATLILVIGGLLLAINWLVFIHVVNHKDWVPWYSLVLKI